MIKGRFLKLLPRHYYRSLRPISTEPNEDVVIAEGDAKKYINNRKFPEQNVCINTCGKIYEERRKNEKFFKIPEGDLAFNVRYIDTLQSGEESSKVNEDSPVVVALHGAPGSYNDYGLLTSFLYDRGVRVVAPCFPDFSEYPPGVFRHSVSEKVQYVKDFLKAIDVSGMDMLVCHSGAVYPGLQLCLENHLPKITTLGLFNPGAYSTNIRGFSPSFFVFKAIVRICETDLGLSLYKRHGQTIFKLLNSVFRVDDIMQPLLTATTMVNADIPKAKQLFYDLSKLQFPIFMAFSENDKLIQKELSYKVAYKLGLFDPQIGLVDKNGKIVREGSEVRNTKVIAFENGSHYVFWKYPQIINNQIYSFMKKHVL